MSNCQSNSVHNDKNLSIGDFTIFRFQYFLMISSETLAENHVPACFSDQEFINRRAEHFEVRYETI